MSISSTIDKILFQFQLLLADRCFIEESQFTHKVAEFCLLGSGDNRHHGRFNCSYGLYEPLNSCLNFTDFCFCFCFFAINLSCFFVWFLINCLSSLFQVAEKPSIALSIASALSHGQVSSKQYIIFLPDTVSVWQENL